MLTIRDAEPADIEAIVRLYEADALGGHGDAWGPGYEARYRAAFDALTASPDTSLHVAVVDGEVVGVFQLVLFTSLSSRGARRAKLAGVQVRADRRSAGFGGRMVAEAEAIAQARGAEVIELTSAKTRRDAHRFYDRLGYERSHEGFRKRL